MNRGSYVHMYLTCVSELQSRHELITIKDGYFTKFTFYKIHFAVQRMPLKALYLDACVDVRLLQKVQ